MTLLLGVLVLTSLVAACASTSIRPDEYVRLMKRILVFHNEKRLAEGASDMAELEWDKDLENDAKAWAARCDFNHADIRNSKEQGENLAWSSLFEGEPVGGKMMGGLQSWFDEKNLYSFGSGNCGSVGACHYTQMVWASTVKLGCAIKICNPLGSTGWSKQAMFLVCRYHKVGNWVGEEPYTPGQACSKCPKGASCKDGLCQGAGGFKGPCIDKENNCGMWADMGECSNNPNFMQKTCRKSCKLCEDEGGNNGGGGDSAPCKDKNGSCGQWAEMGECDRNPAYMKPNCAKSCGACGGGGGGGAVDCNDNNGGCKGWAKRGECQRNPGYMMSNCKKSCNAC